MASILLNDIDLQFPNFTVVSASAGSGKTHTLTLKILQLLLSLNVPNNRLNNILAMTFTKNAAAEMRQRILDYLKKASLGDTNILAELSTLVSLEESDLRTRCGGLIDTILQDYSAFQVQTIDSFMARVFRASALEFGYSPSLEVVIHTDPILDAAFEQFARELALDPLKQKLLEDLTEILVDSQNTSSRYIWDPFQKLSEEVRNLYDALSAQPKNVLSASDDAGQGKMLRNDLLTTARKLCALVKDSGLERKRYFENVQVAAQAGDVDKLIGLKSINDPLKAGKSKSEQEQVAVWSDRFAPLQQHFSALKKDYILQKAYSYYRPYVEAHKIFHATIEKLMRQNGQVNLADVNRKLVEYISEEIVPQVFFYLGDTVCHYLIDEFQDTSPLQWETVKPLFTEALSKKGSLFIVGDTKQSIYAFRHADWRIMKSLMGENIFPSVRSKILELETNYRSFERILEFNDTVFHSLVPSILPGGESSASGLSAYRQTVDKKNRKKGYVEVVSFENDDDGNLQRTKILEIVNECRTRGYRCGDITILTPKNEHVVAISGWLNSASIKFISHSSLDIRGRAITNDCIAFLRFLDSPIDDLAFTTVVLSGIFHRALVADGSHLSQGELQTFLLNARRAEPPAPMYALFRNQYPKIWKRYFEEFFTLVGYLPMYDLLSEIYKHFRVFDRAPEEEAVLAKLLEVMKNFEETGQNNLKEFLRYADDEADDSEWNIAVPPGADAVSVMTIHKAKGLDNRVVIVLLVDSKPRNENLFMEEREDGVRLVRITKDMTDSDATLEKLYSEQRFKHTVDDLNKLYVAFTRAKEEMYIISVKSERTDGSSKFLPSAGFEPSGKPDVKRQVQPDEPSIQAYHSSVRVPATEISSGPLALYERRRGEAIHDVLAQVEFVNPDIEEIISASLRKTAGSRMHPAEQSRMKSIILEFLLSPDIAPFFAPLNDRIIMNEQEFVSSEGQLFRMDRIIVDKNIVTVVDFKTGDDKESYTHQLEGYRRILEDFYPGRAIQGVLAFVDRKKLRVIA